jgi:hypothetical protein
MKFWIAVYSHKHGIDSWPIWGDEHPDEDAVKKEIDFVEDEGITLYPEVLDFFGPFEVPSDIIAQIKAA